MELLSPQWQKLFLANMDLIDAIINKTCARCGLGGEDVRDFGSTVKTKLIENEYAIFRGFEGRSSLRTYLTIVIANECRDFRNKIWGKWRPSSEAKRLGGSAIQLETLISRDGYSLDQAIQVMLTNHHVPMSERELRDLAVHFPVRQSRALVGEEHLESLTEPDAHPERQMVNQETVSARQEAMKVLARLQERLPVEDRLIIKMRFWDDVKVATIARIIHHDQRKLYRRIDRIINNLKEEMRREGVDVKTFSTFLDK